MNKVELDMDTIELGCENPHALEELIGSMKQKCDSIERLSFSSAARRGYRNHLAIDMDGSKWCLFWERKYLSRPLFTFQLQASQFKNIEELCNHLHELWGPFLNAALDAEIRRFDICVDLLLPIETISQCLQQPRARIATRYTSTTTGFIIGKYPKETAFYEREMLPEQADFRPEGGMAYNANEKLMGTRIEVRHWGSRVPIRCLREIDKLYDLHPFAHVLLKPVNLALIAKATDIRTRRNIDAYLHRVSQVGAHQARKEFNKGGNFERTVGRFLKPLPGIDLQDIYLDRVERFLSPESRLINISTQALLRIEAGDEPTK